MKFFIQESFHEMKQEKMSLCLRVPRGSYIGYNVKCKHLHFTAKYSDHVDYLKSINVTIIMAYLDDNMKIVTSDLNDYYVEYYRGNFSILEYIDYFFMKFPDKKSLLSYKMKFL